MDMELNHLFNVFMRSHGPTLTTHLPLALTLLILLHIAIVDPGKFRLLVDTSSVLHASATFWGAVAPAGPRMGETLPRHILIIVGWVKNRLRLFKLFTDQNPTYNPHPHIFSHIFADASLLKWPWLSWEPQIHRRKVTVDRWESRNACV